jgi:hypothetical protein
LKLKYAEKQFVNRVEWRVDNLFQRRSKVGKWWHIFGSEHLELSTSAQLDQSPEISKEYRLKRREISGN